MLALPPGQKLRLEAALGAVLAEEELRTTGGVDLTLEGYHALVLLATGSKAEAERRTRARMAAQLRRGEQPA